MGFLKEKGVTLVELVIVIVLSGLLVVILSSILGKPFLAYSEQSNRAELVSAADAAIYHLSRDLRSALPNSIRISGNYMEMVPIIDGGRYRAAHSGNVGSDFLDFSSVDSSFQAMDASLSQPPAGSRLVIYNTGQTNAAGGSSIYNGVSSGPVPSLGAGVITPVSTTLAVTNASESLVTLSAPFQFSFSSPSQRFYFVSTALTYYCNPGTSGFIQRYSNYTIQNTQPVTTGSAPLSGAISARLTDRVSSCNFSYQEGVAERGGLVTIDLALTQEGESVRLLHQVHVGNGI